MYVVLLLCGAALGLLAVCHGALFMLEKVRRFTGHAPRRARRGRYVPISATHLPV